MPTYKTADSSGEFTFELDYSKDNIGFEMRGMRIHKDGQTLFAKENMTGFYRNEGLLQAHGIYACEEVAQHLRKRLQ